MIIKERTLSHRFAQINADRFKYKEQIGFCFFRKIISVNLRKSVAKIYDSTDNHYSHLLNHP